MPHTNRKKKGAGAKEGPKVVHTKRQQIEDDKGWTHVVDTPRRGVKTDPEKRIQFHAGDFERNGVSYINMTLQEMGKNFEYYTKQWNSNEASGLLEEKLTPTEGKVTVNNVVCLGLGSLQRATRESRRASYIQLAALRAMMEVMAREQNLPCALQDPQFTELDKEFLSSLGYTVVDDPEAFTKINENALVYAIHVYPRLYSAVSEGPYPAMMVGNSAEELGKFNLHDQLGPMIKKMEEMLDGCDEIDFPQIRHDFSNTKIYWRKASEAVKE